MNATDVFEPFSQVVTARPLATLHASALREASHRFVCGPLRIPFLFSAHSG